MQHFSRAFAPSHITGFFKIYPNGSTGAGVNTALGAHSTVRFTTGPTSFTINDEVSPAPVSQRVVESYQHLLENRNLQVDHTLDYPIGYGMGMSGAGAYSLSLALNELLGSPLPSPEVLEIAVQAEIASGTGLGDVIAQQFPGLMIGLPPYPSRTVAEIPSAKQFIATAFFAPIETGKIIRDPQWKARINEVGERCMQALAPEPTVDRFMTLCREFTFETNLASPEVRAVLEALPEASMAMLGQTVFLFCNSELEGTEILKPFSSRILVAPLATEGARIV